MNRKEIDFEGTLRKLKDFLSGQDEVVFAYLHGSFAQGEEFRDVDVAVFLDDRATRPTDDVEYEISLSLKLEKELGLPVDIKILNHAPLSFRYHASQGTLLLTGDESTRESFLNRTWSEYFDFQPLSRIYLEDLTRA
jgi:predicted nucleotidyltransferase